MTDLRNRIVGISEMDPEQILAHPNNWRVHSKKQQKALEEMWDSVGNVQPVMINKTTGHLVDGHMRVMVAMRKGVKSLPVMFVELDEDEENAILASLDPIAAMAGVDDKNLRRVLKDSNRKVSKVAADLLFDFGESMDAALADAVAATTPTSTQTENDDTVEHKEVSPIESSGEANVESQAAPSDDAPSSELVVIAHCENRQQQLDAQNAMRALGLKVTVKP